MTEEGNIYILVPQANKEELKLTPYNREPQNQMWLVQQAITVSVQNRQKFHRSQARSWWVEGNCKCMETLIIGLLHVVTCDGLGIKWLMKLPEMRSLELQLSSITCTATCGALQCMYASGSLHQNLRFNVNALSSRVSRTSTLKKLLAHFPLIRADGGGKTSMGKDECRFCLSPLWRAWIQELWSILFDLKLDRV